jgi:hypothetical protein
MTKNTVSIALDQDSLARFASLLGNSNLATGVHCGDDGDVDGFCATGAHCGDDIDG